MMLVAHKKQGPPATACKVTGARRGPSYRDGPFVEGDSADLRT